MKRSAVRLRKAPKTAHSGRVETRFREHKARINIESANCFIFIIPLFLIYQLGGVEAETRPRWVFMKSIALRIISRDL